MQELIERWQAGDVDAFDELFHQYKKLVFKSALLISGNVGDAEDILQEVFLKLWTSKHTYSSRKGNFINWLYKITVNQSISKCRKKKIHSLSLDQIDSGSGIVDNRERIEPNLDRKWEYEALTKLVSQMDEKHRLVLILRYFNDLPNNAIAEILDIPIGTVKSRLHNALASLRKKWDGMEEK
ncbi:MAG: RNA polymerase sigma factor [Candidatus Paceibacterota bacterium]|jgi:RNA polymerase sigma-70 factor (ECF subfamily)